MNITVALNLVPGDDAPSEGGGVLAETLIEGLRRFDDHNRYLVLALPHRCAIERQRLPNPRWEVVATSDPALDCQTLAQVSDVAGRELNELLGRHGVDVLLTLAMVATPAARCATVGTILDSQAERFPEYHSTAELSRRSVVHETILRTSTRVMTISRFVRRELIERFGASPGRIEVVHPALDPQLVEPTACSATVVGAPKRLYALYPATLWPHKNHALLVEALGRCRDRGVDLDLVLTGRGPTGRNAVGELAERWGLSDHVHCRGIVSRSELAGLYRGARMVVYPSRYEGFGLPIIEGMALGCPVIASWSASLPEVAGDAGLLCDPEDPADLADAMTAVAADDALASRLRERGARRARLFSLEPATRRLIALLEDAARLGPREARPSSLLRPNRTVPKRLRVYFHANELREIQIEGRVEPGKRLCLQLDRQTPREIVVRPEGDFQFVLVVESHQPGHELQLCCDGAEGSAECRLDRLLVRTADRTLDLLPVGLEDVGNGRIGTAGRPDLMLSAWRQAVTPLTPERGLRLALYPAGRHSRRLLQCLDPRPSDIVCLVDDAPVANEWAGVPVIRPCDWERYRPDAVVVSSDTIQEELYLRALEWVPPGVPVVRLYPH